VKYISDTVDGQPVTIFVPANHDEYVAITTWCKKNIGCTHGSHSIWYVCSRFQVNPAISGKVIVVKAGFHITLCLLTWG
jgi:hypothetical protein